jgi:hypothetical protein
LRTALAWLDAKEVDMRESVIKGHHRILPRRHDAYPPRTSWIFA